MVADDVTDTLRDTGGIIVSVRPPFPLERTRCSVRTLIRWRVKDGDFDGTVAMAPHQKPMVFNGGGSVHPDPDLNDVVRFNLHLISIR
jgi:hypothetical protein